MNIDKPFERDERLFLYRLAVEKMAAGNYKISVPTSKIDDIGCLGQALKELADHLQARSSEEQRMHRITANMNAGLVLEDILDSIYRDFKGVIPYNRIGLALLQNGGDAVISVWGKSDQPVIKLDKGYSAPLLGSSLEKVLNTGQPRIIDDLLAYLKTKPQSESTHLIVSEGIRSSLTCPLQVDGSPVGFLFFSSVEPHTYEKRHIDTFQKIANEVSLCVEKGRLASELAASKYALETQNEDLRRMNEIKNTFLAIAAHDLRSPLSQIQLAADLLLEPDQWMSEDERKSLLQSFLANIENQSKQMLGLINDLLDVSQIEAGKLSLKFESIPLIQFMETIALEFTRLATKEIRVELLDIPDERIVADSQRLRQVLDNLVSNAVKYSPPGSRVVLDVQRESFHWRFSVIDQGPGFNPEDLGNLFQETALLAETNNLRHKSAGLGLAISRRIVEAHGGKIGVETSPGEGSTFWFTLPY
jgi:signal transduction histidine kinase